MRAALGIVLAFLFRLYLHISIISLMVGACLNALDLGEVQRLEEIEGIVVHLGK
jgi:hypothetical protein